jgi:nitrogen-specific signal transduction histidine kinase
VSGDEAPGAPPWLLLRERLAQEADAAQARGEAAGAAALREVTRDWWTRQLEWNAKMSEALGAHHEINNALVGIRGNAQLLLMNPAVQSPGIRERLEVVLRESGRIQEAAGRLRELKAGSGLPPSSAQAA